jgi:hypothetical protein
MEERLEELTEDPEKFRKAFKVTWIVAYSMLVLGGIIIIWVLLQGRI